MTFEYRDADGGHLSVTPLPGVPYVLVRTDPEGCAVPADLVPDAIAGIRDAARTAASRQTTGQDDTWPLATPCGYCSHTLNWHVTGGRCRVTAREASCGCSAFVAPDGSHPDSAVVDEFIRDMATQHPACACTHPQERHLSACTECPCVGYASTWPPSAAPAVGQPAEAQDADEAHPAQHRWAAELHDPLADEWVPGTRYPDRDRAVAALAHARAVGSTWKDGTPVDRRLVRETTTWTVEDER